MKRVLLISVIWATVVFTACTATTTVTLISTSITTTTLTLTPTSTAAPANLTAGEADFIVISAVSSNPGFPETGFSFQTEFNPLYRQWHITILTIDKSTWGHVYLVDDTTGKVLNLP